VTPPLLAISVVLLVALGEAYGYLRAAVAAVMFLGIFVFGIRWIRSAITSPPEPEIADVSDYGLKYVCTMCGLELKVEVAARDKAPTHCMEPMVLVQSGGKPPLRPVD
jgi:hypothetical protein